MRLLTHRSRSRTKAPYVDEITRLSLIHRFNTRGLPDREKAGNPDVAATPTNLPMSPACGNHFGISGARLVQTQQISLLEACAFPLPCVPLNSGYDDSHQLDVPGRLMPVVLYLSVHIGNRHAYSRSRGTILTLCQKKDKKKRTFSP